jgi:YihY family inner membrane protein
MAGELREASGALGQFMLQALKAFKANQGLLLAGAVAYYALLSIVPLLILIVIALSHLVGTDEVIDALSRYLEWIVPGQSGPLIDELENFMEHRDVAGWVIFGTMVFFSSLAFTVVENAMSVIFYHRVAVRKRHFLASLVMPYCYIVLLGAGFLLVTVVSGALEALGEEQLHLLGHVWSLDPLSRVMLYAMGFLGEVLVLSSIYLVMPVGRLSWRHAIIGGATAALLWELTRHVLAWYYGTLSKVSVVYGSLSTAIVVLLSLEFAAILLLFGAQVIAEYERRERGGEPDAAPAPLRTD